MEALIIFIDNKLSGVPYIMLATAWAFSISSNAIIRWRTGAVNRKYVALKKSPVFRDQPAPAYPNEEGWSSEEPVRSVKQSFGGSANGIETKGGEG